MMSCRWGRAAAAAEKCDRKSIEPGPPARRATRRMRVLDGTGAVQSSTTRTPSRAPRGMGVVEQAVKRRHVIPSPFPSLCLAIGCNHRRDVDVMVAMHFACEVCKQNTSMTASHESRDRSSTFPVSRPRPRPRPDAGVTAPDYLLPEPDDVRSLLEQARNTDKQPDRPDRPPLRRRRSGPAPRRKRPLRSPAVRCG
jgi:hypothetical protein